MTTTATKTYEGTKRVHARPMNRGEYNAYMAIKNVNETVSTWVPSVNDCIAEDWEVLA